MFQAYFQRNPPEVSNFPVQHFEILALFILNDRSTWAILSHSFNTLPSLVIWITFFLAAPRVHPASYPVPYACIIRLYINRWQVLRGNRNSLMISVVRCSHIFSGFIITGVKLNKLFLIKKFLNNYF